MPGTSSPVSDFPDAGPLTGTEFVPVIQDGVDKKTTPQEIADLATGGSIPITYSDLSTLKDNSELIPGVFYFITDENIVLQATSESSLSLFGSYLAFNGDYQLGGDYSGVEALTGFPAGSILGQWLSGLSHVANDMVIYNGIHWQAKTAIDTVPVAGINWIEVPRGTNEESIVRGYISEVDYIEYDFDTQSIIKRIDKRGNSISASIGQFQWGNDSVVKMKGDGILCLNNSGTIENVNAYDALFDASENSGQIERILLENGNLLCPTNAGEISVISIRNSTEVVANLNEGVSVRRCSFEDNLKISTNQIVLDQTKDEIGQVVYRGKSTFKRDFDITGLTIIDLTIANNYFGIINLTSSNPTETVDSISNINDNHPVEFNAATGLSVGFTGTERDGISADKILQTDINFVLVGQDIGSDSFIVKKTETFVTEVSRVNIV